MGIGGPDTTRRTIGSSVLGHRLEEPGGQLRPVQAAVQVVLHVVAVVEAALVVRVRHAAVRHPEGAPRACWVDESVLAPVSGSPGSCEPVCRASLASHIIYHAVARGHLMA